MAGHGSSPPDDKARHPGRVVTPETFSTSGMSDADIRAHRVATHAYELRPAWNDDDAWEEGRRLNREGYD
jgi:hypothetical protein